MLRTLAVQSTLQTLCVTSTELVLVTSYAVVVRQQTTQKHTRNIPQPFHSTSMACNSPHAHLVYQASGM